MDTQQCFAAKGTTKAALISLLESIAVLTQIRYHHNGDPPGTQKGMRLQMTARVSIA
jgi:hypothetical protein